MARAINAFVAAYNEDPKPFVWTASVDAGGAPSGSS